ncbi:DNA polymerase III subunit gamma/tau [Granulicella arctica]|uniref:DNA polymerase III subunit gamma/tau n=1 Tax=Granulicella arctica TaxID=940613 RepID=A0A7Y9PHR5_9BACT|nr:DNA polymerase III subunit gamma/tau [Granulicella arctica]NYF80134.1 DNA polymerase-3 subunit gamma/tau [Granulicella arctica]
MAYQVLARKYRPQRFADVAGQDHVTVTLMNALTQQRIAHGYIFSGHRGIGKTTIARILAMALNCRNVIGSPQRPTAEPCEICESCTEIRAGNAVDVIEIDAATNRGIDEIRELRDAARYAPARDRYKIYILDEAHQITDAAFNALLKTLEEPPEHIVFMMATTQPEDIPQTVRSRCQHFSFHAVKLVDILGELRGIATKEGIDADDAALSLLAEAGDGSMRDALSIMDQAIASAPMHDGRAVLDASQIRELMGTVPNAVFEKILEAVDQNRSAEVMTVANQLLDSGNSPAQLARQCCRYLRNTLIAKIANVGSDGVAADGAAGELLQISADEQRRAGRSAALFTEEELTRFLQIMLRTFDELGYRQEQRFHFELGLLKLVHLRRLLPVEELLSGIPVAPGSGGTQRGISAPKSTSSPAPSTASAAVRTQPVTPAFVLAPAPPRPTPPPHPVLEKPTFSPFQQNTTRAEDISAPAPPIIKPAAAVINIPVEVKLPEPVPTPAAIPIEIETTAPEPAILPSVQADAAPEIATTNSPEAAALQQTAVEALTNARGQQSAADALDEAEWHLDGITLKVQTGVSKTMLPIVVNAEAEKIVRAAIGAGIKLTILPGTAATSEKKKRPAHAGSAQAKATEHPIVQQAQRLFNAEIRSVIDLRDDN